MVARVRAVFWGAVILGLVVFASMRFRQGHDGPAHDRSNGPPSAQNRVRVEVLNSGGRPGAAKEATELLRKHGFDVVYFGNADTFGRDSSVVLDRVGATEHAKAVAEALGIESVRSEPDPNLYLDVSVMLGRAWRPDSATARAARASARH